MKNISKANLDIVGLPGIFQGISDNCQSGTLRIESEEQEIYIYFREGRIQLIAYPDRHSLLVEAVRRNLLSFDDEVMEALFHQNAVTGKSLATLLLEMGIADTNTLTEVCRFQVGEEICDIFTWGDVHCEFTEGPPPTDLFEPELIDLPIDLQADALLMEAARRLDEWELFSQSFPSMRDIPYLKHPLEDHHSPEVEHLINLIDGIQDIEEILYEVRMPPFRAMKYLYELYQAGQISLKSARGIRLLASRDTLKSKTEKCIKLHERAEELGEKDLESVAWLANAYERTNDTIKAATKYKELGELYLSLHDYGQAVNAFRKVVQYAPENMEGYEKLIYCLNKSGQLEESSKISTQYAKRLSQQNPKRAMLFLEETSKNFPANPDNLGLLADLYLQADEKINAIRIYRLLITLLRKQHKLEEVVRVYRKIINFDPQNVDSHHHLAKTLLEIGRDEEGIVEYKTLGTILHSSDNLKNPYRCKLLISTCETIIQFEPHNAPAREWLVDAYLALNNRQKARETLYELLNLLEKKGDPSALVMNLKKVVAMEPSNLQYRQRLAKGYLKLQHLKEAKQEYMALYEQAIASGELRFARDALDAILQWEPFNLQARQKRADILASLNLRAKAAEEFKLVGYMAKAIEQFEEAIAAFARLTELAPDKEFFVFWELARLCELSKKNDQAILYYQKFVQRNMHHGNYGQALTACRRLSALCPEDQEIKNMKKKIEEILAQRPRGNW